MFIGSAIAQVKDISERYAPVEDNLRIKSNNQPGPYNRSRTALRGGGGDIITTDCYSFVPVPEDAIELDENAMDFGNSLDGAWGPFDLDFSFCHFGDSYDQFYINMKGNITFDDFNTTFVPAGFPSDDFAMVSGYWADIDLTCPDCGTVYYWTTPTAAYITFVDVGYYLDHGDLNNTFQIVITDQTDEIVGLGNNVGLFYQDMQWAAGDWNGGNNGFGGTAAGTVGANKNDGANYIQFGRFLNDSDAYDGPFGTDDGIHWLDDKAFVFNLCSSEDNLPPIAGNSDACDTIFLCQPDSYELDLSFLAPEPGQNVTITVDDSGATGWTLETNGNGFLTGTFSGTADNIGEHTLVITATDDGMPVGTTTVTYNFVVQDVLLPPLTVSGEGFSDDVVSYCGGLDGAELTASDGYDVYVWSNNTNGQTQVLDGGQYTVTGILEGCEITYGPLSVIEIPAYNPNVMIEDLFLCEGEETQITLEDPEDYTSIEWAVYNNDGTIISEDLEADEVTVTPGFYTVTVVDETGCEGTRIVPVALQVAVTPNNNFNALCDENEVSWTGAYTNPEDCVHFIYLYDDDGDQWQGANMEVYVDGTGPFNFNISNASMFVPTGIQAYNGQVIEYYFTSGVDDEDIDIAIFECGNNTPIFDSNEGDEITEGLFFTQIANTEVNPIQGAWTSSCPDGTFSDPEVYNPIGGNQIYTVPEGFVGTCDLTFVADEGVCNIEDSFTLTFSTEPTLEMSSEVLIGCDADGVEIIPVVGPEGLPSDFNYDWTPNGNCDGNPTCTVTSSGTYLLTVSDDAGCGQVSGTTEVEITPTPNASLSDMTLCDGASATLNPGSTDDSFVYSWSGPGVDNLTTSTVTAQAGGTYTVNISNECGGDDATAEVNAFNSPSVVYAVDSIRLCPGESTNIEPEWNGGESDPGDILWNVTYTDTVQFTQTTSLENTSPLISYSSAQIPVDAELNQVQISFSAVNGCGTATGSVNVEAIGCFINAYNVFTPDSDNGSGSQIAGFDDGQGLNEIWQIVGIENLNNIHVRIFNRWGQLVWEETNYKNTRNRAWDGRNTNGVDLEAGVYFYTIDAAGAVDPIQGSVTLLRGE